MQSLGCIVCVFGRASVHRRPPLIRLIDQPITGCGSYCTWSFELDGPRAEVTWAAPQAGGGGRERGNEISAAWIAGRDVWALWSEPPLTDIYVE